VFVEDLAPFFSDFGQPATLAGVAVTGIFDNPYTEAFGMASRVPIFQLPTEDLGAAVQGSTLVTGGVTFRVTAVQDDGTGVTTLILERS